MPKDSQYLLGIYRENPDEPGIGVFGYYDGSVDVAELPPWMAGKRWDQNYVKPNYVNMHSVTFFVNLQRPPQMPGKPEWLKNVDREIPQADGPRQTVELDPHQLREDLPALWMTYDFVTHSWWVDETSPGWIFPGEGWSPVWNTMNPRP